MIKNSAALRGLPALGTIVYEPGSDKELEVVLVQGRKVTVRQVGEKKTLAFNAYPAALRSLPGVK